jgi:hypothetical protein
MLGPRINPAFDRFPREAHFIGRILASFGEIEFSVCRNAGHAAVMPDQIPKALYRLRTTSSRLDAADAIMRPAFDANGLSDEYRIATRGVSYCLRVRNKYAHCNWADDTSAGLFFADLQEAADAEIGFAVWFQHVDAPLLEAQYGFFSHVMEWLTFRSRLASESCDRLLTNCHRNQNPNFHHPKVDMNRRAEEGIGDGAVEGYTPTQKGSYRIS